MFDALRFWLDRGVDGFRVDVIWLLIKDDRFRDNPPNPAWQPHQPGIDRLLQLYSADRPETLDVVAEMRAVVDAYPERVLIGEIYLPLERARRLLRRGTWRACTCPSISSSSSPPGTRGDLARVVAEYEAALPAGGWPNWVLGNHDQQRIATRVGAAQARVAAMLLLTLRGTPTLYYGDEIGLENVPIPPDRVQDPWERNEPGLGLGRDPARTPMPWDGSPGAGFTTGTPWLPLNPDHATRNVAALSADDASILALYRRLLALRRAEPALACGRWFAVPAEGTVFAYERRHQGRRILVALNLGHAAQALALPRDAPRGQVLLATGLGRAGEAVSEQLALGPDEGLVVALAG